MGEPGDEPVDGLAFCWHMGRGSTPQLVTLRRRVSESMAHLDEDTLFELQLVCAELVRNVYHHAGGVGELRVMQRSPEATIRVEANDSSPALPKLLPTPRRKHPGHGLQIVNGLATAWGATRTAHGKTIWVQLDPAT